MGHSRNNEASSCMAAITFSCVLVIILGLFSYVVFNPSDKLVKEDTEYLYIKKYSCWGTDSCINKYHKPILYNGVISNIDVNSYIVGPIGKGGHWETNTNITISFGDKIYKDTHTEWGTTSLVKYKKGDKVKVKEIFYPQYKVEYY